LFTSAADAAEDRRKARQVQAQQQLRCRCCGRFARAQEMQWRAVCGVCIYEDQRPAIRRKVLEAQRWWGMLHPD